MLRLNSQEQRYLLLIARTAVHAALTGETRDELSPPTEALKAQLGAFVSIHREGRLRGCIGRVQSDMPLHETTSACAISAATRDLRFPQLGIDELREVSFEISVLGCLERLTQVDKIRVPGHGLMVEMCGKRGLLLPQVGAANGWNRLEFLSHTCLKAGLRHDAWAHGAQVFLFEALVFGDSTYK
jgi:AmmeMemoRadiSam system protein A